MATDIQTHSDAAAQTAPQPPAVRPRVDIYENDREFLVVADVPGVEAGGVDAHLDGGELRIRATQASLSEAEGFVPAVFERVFGVPDTVDAEGVRAELHAGVLTVHLAKAAAARPRQIPVTS